LGPHSHSKKKNTYTKVHFCTKNISYKTACTNGFSGDEHEMFETCRRNEELNYDVNFKKAYVFVGLHYIIVSQCTVQKNINF